MPNWKEFFRSDPAICGGELCAAGTRVPVTVILDSLAKGATSEQILKSYPTLAPEHIGAALAYAVELTHEEQLVPLRASQSSSWMRTCRSN